MRGRAREAALAAAGTLLYVLAVCWRLWTPIAGARRVFAAAPTARALALQVIFGLGVYAWIRARRLPAAPAAMAAGVALVAIPGIVGGLVPFVPWLLVAAELMASRSRRPLLEPAVPILLVAAALLLARGSLAPPAAWLGPLVPRHPGALIYAGVIPLVAGFACRPSLRTLALAAAAAAGLVTGSPLLFVLALCALSAEGVAALGAGHVRLLSVVAVVVAAVVGAAAAITARPRATPLHDALVIAFFAWTVSLWALRQLAADDGRARRLLLCVVACVAVCDAWFAHAPRIESQFTSRVN